MRLVSIEDQQVNLFTKVNKIPLGMNSYKGMNKDKIICMPYEKYSGAWGLIAKSGAGKTVLLKRIYSYVLGFYQKKYRKPRPAVIFDMQSEDHQLSRFPNTAPEHLFYDQGEKPFGFDNLVCYAPEFILEESHPHDRPFGFSVDNFTTRDFATIGMGVGASKFLSFLIKSNPECAEDLDKLFKALNDLPTNLTEFKRLPADYMFKLDNFVNYSSKLSLTNNFAMAYEDNAFCDTRNKHHRRNFIPELQKGKIVVINFHQEDKYYPLYAGKIMRDIYLKRRDSARKNDFSFAPPVIIIEEADLLAPNNTDDSFSSIYWLKQILKRGRKYSFFSILATQEASSLNEDIRNNTRQWVIGSLNEIDISFFQKILTPHNLNVVLNLDKSKHEFVIVYEDGTFDSFYAWDSPVQINRENSMV